MDKEEVRIIKQTQQGSSAAFEKIFQKYGSTVYGICLRYSSSTDEASDILQEAFIKVFQRIKLFKFEGSFEGWLKRLTTNCALDYLRANEKYRFDTDSSEMPEHLKPTTSADILEKLSTDEMLQIITELPPSYRMVFNLYAIDGYKHAEIAKMLNISEGTSKSNLHDARKILQKRLNQIMDDSNVY